MVAIYLAGKIQKAHENPNETYWSEDDLTLLRQELGKVTFLNPALRSDDLSDQKSVFGRDMTQVFCSDVVFADVRDRRGLGVGAEMMWAKMNRIPVLCWAPPGSHYHKDSTTLLGVQVNDWVHPFVVGLADGMVATLAEGAAWIKDLGHHEIKGPEAMHEAMAYYRETNYDNDLPMIELARMDDTLNYRLRQILI